MLEKIIPIAPSPKKTLWKDKCTITINGLEPHTLAFITAEARQRGMSNSQFMKEICERLESGEF